MPLVRTQAVENIFWVFGIVLGKDHINDAKQIMKKLSEKNIGTRAFFYPMHLQPALNGMRKDSNISLPISENLATRGFYLPSGLTLLDEEINKVAEVLKFLLQHNKIP